MHMRTELNVIIECLITTHQNTSFCPKNLFAIGYLWIRINPIILKRRHFVFLPFNDLSLCI
jgi:hypothetical protein